MKGLMKSIILPQYRDLRESYFFLNLTLHLRSDQIITIPTKCRPIKTTLKNFSSCPYTTMVSIKPIRMVGLKNGLHFQFHSTHMHYFICEFPK